MAEIFFELTHQAGGGVWATEDFRVAVGNGVNEGDVLAFGRHQYVAGRPEYHNDYQGTYVSFRALDPNLTLQQAEADIQLDDCVRSLDDDGTTVVVERREVVTEVYGAPVMPVVVDPFYGGYSYGYGAVDTPFVDGPFDAPGRFDNPNNPFD